MLEDSIFRNSAYQENQVDVLIGGRYKNFPGFWPLLDETNRLTRFVAVGNKNGVPWDRIREFKKVFRNKFKLIYSCQNGPAFVNDFDRINREFDGIFDTDYNIFNSKRLNCSHTMMVRSFPCDGLFWEPIDCDKVYDFNILTVPKIGSKTKRWDRGERVCFSLCKAGFKGVVYSQTGNCLSLISKRLMKYVKAGQLVIRDGGCSPVDFHREACKALCTIFPNNVDAFPKFIIESLLANRVVVISKDLLLGRRVLNSIGESIVIDFDFDTSNYSKLITSMSRLRKDGVRNVHPREVWLRDYNFKGVSIRWANEFNKVFDTDFRQLYYMNHIPRLEKCYKLRGFSKSYFFM